MQISLDQEKKCFAKKLGEKLSERKALLKILKNISFPARYSLLIINFLQINRENSQDENIKRFQKTRFKALTLKTWNQKQDPGPYPAGIYLLKVNNRNTRTRCERCEQGVIF